VNKFQPKIMISAGEASGDLHAANMIKELKTKGYQPTIYGMGGPKLADEGMEQIVDCKEMAVIGIVEVLIQYRKIISKLKLLQQRLIADPPDVLILVDYQDFNMRLAETGKQNGIKVLFYISPQVWAWRSERVKKIGKRIDLMAVIFPFEVDFYKKANIPVEYVGHPLLSKVKPSMTVEQAIQTFKLDKNKAIVSLLPGSRKGEIKRNLPVILKSCHQISQTLPDCQFLLAMAPSVDEEQVSALIEQYKINVQLIKGQTYDVVNVADTVITSSGTATLEVGLLSKPMVIMYKVNPLTYAIMNPLITIDDIGLVNIVAQKKVVQEFIQKTATANNIATETLKILQDANYKNTIISELKKIKPKMAQENITTTIGECVIQLLQK